MSGSNVAPGPSPSDVSTSMFLQNKDLKRKVARLTETTTQYSQDTHSLTPMKEKTDLAEKQIMRWRHRLPDLTDDESDEQAATAVDVQEQLNSFKGAVCRKTEDIQHVTTALEDKVNILRRVRNDAWELVNDRTSSELSRTSMSLSERLTGLERDGAISKCITGHYCRSASSSFRRHSNNSSQELKLDVRLSLMR